MTLHATGTFDIALTPAPQADEAQPEDSIPGRLLIDKQFYGDLEGVSRGKCWLLAQP